MRDAASDRSGRLFAGPPAYTPRTPWRPGAALLATVVIVGASLLGARYLPALLGLHDTLIGTAQPGAAPTPGMSAGALWLVGIFQVLAIALTLAACGFFGGRVRDVLALGPAPTGWAAYASAILAMALLQMAVAVVQNIVLKHDMLTDLRPFIGLVTGPYWPLAAAVLGIGAPLSEELLFRGFLLGALAKSRLGFWGAAIISTGLWTAMHAGYSLMGLAEVFVIGMLLSWLLWRTGSLRVTIFCHALYNSLIVLALRLVELPA